jgi:hypothetical protein
MGRVLALVWSGLWALPTALFGLVFYTDYWRLRSCFEPSTGACFVESEVRVYHDTNFIWIFPTAFCLLMVLLGLWAARRPKASVDPVETFT